MSPGSEPSAPPPPRPVPERLRDYARYLGLVAEELEALEHRDLGRLREIAEERDELEGELLAEEAAGEPDPNASAPIELAKLLARGLEALHQGEEEDRMTRDRWSSIEEDALRAMQGVRLAAVRGGRYLELASPDARLDVRF